MIRRGLLLSLAVAAQREIAEDVRIGRGDDYKYQTGEWSMLVVSDGKDNIVYSGATYEGNLQVLESQERFLWENGYFKISNVEESDEGEYSIKISQNSKYSEKSINLTVLIPPKIKIEKIIEVMYEGDSEVNVAKCTAEGGKPQATVTWNFIGFSQDLAGAPAPEENMLSLVPTREMHKIEVQCTVKHEALSNDLTQDIHLNVEYKPGKPIMKIIDADCDDEVSNKKVKLVCVDNALAANPKVDYFEWIIPGEESTTVGPDKTVDPSLVNESSIYKCRASNKRGASEFQEKNLSGLNTEACPSTAQFTGIVIGVVVIVVVIIVAVVIFWWRKLFCFGGKKAEPKQDYDLEPRYAQPYSKNDNVVKNGGQTYDYQPQPPKTAPPVEDSDDESDGAGHPLVSQNNQRDLPNEEDDEYLDDAANRYSPDYVPPTEPHYASLNKDVLGTRQSATPIDRSVEYASLSNQKFQMV